MKASETELPFEPVDEAEQRVTPTWAVVLAAMLIAIPLGFCCYWFLR